MALGETNCFQIVPKKKRKDPDLILVLFGVFLVGRFGSLKERAFILEANLKTQSDFQTCP